MKTKLILLLLAVDSFSLQGQQYAISTIAGGGEIPASAPASEVTIPVGFGIAVGAGGDVFFDSSNAVMKVDSAGTLTRIAGTGVYGISADGGAAATSTLAWPAGLAIDNAGNLYIAENAAHRVRKVSPQGMITTVAGTGTGGFSGDGGPALTAQLNWPVGLALDAAGNLFIADTGNQVVRKVSANGVISTFATGFHFNEGVAVDAAGNVYATDAYDDPFDCDGAVGSLLKITPNGASSEILGPVYSGGATGVAVDPSGNIYLAAGGVVKLTPDGTVSGDNSDVLAVATDSSGNLYLSNGFTLLTRVSGTGAKTTLIGNGPPGSSYWGDGGKAVEAGLNEPIGVAVDTGGNIYISDSGNSRVRKVTPDGLISTFAGSGLSGFSGDGGPARAAQLSAPSGLALDAAGNLYIADRGNNRIRKVSTDGTINTVAGSGEFSLPLGDGGLATNASLAAPFGVAVDANGNLYIADTQGLLIRKVSPSGIITSVAGSPTYAPGPNQIGYPLNLAVYKAGDVYIATFTHSGESQILELSTAGALSTVAGTTNSAISAPTGDGGPALNATLQPAAGVAVDATGSIWIAGGDLDGGPGAGYIREIGTDGIIHTIAGNGAAGYSGDGGPASQAMLSAAAGQVAVDASGNVYFADIYNNAVRVLRH